MVQGVFFRDHTQEKANELQLKGWVKNMSDGTVEVVLQGEESQIQLMIDWCHQGSPGSEVSDVKVEWISTNPDLSDFQVHY